MNSREAASLDRHITGNYGEDQFRSRKRESDGKYAFDGNLERMCVCGHALAHHSGGSSADCLVYSFSEKDQAEMVNGDKPNCGCQKFRLSRKRSKG